MSDTWFARSFSIHSVSLEQAASSSAALADTAVKLSLRQGPDHEAKKYCVTFQSPVCLLDKHVGWDLRITSRSWKCSSVKHNDAYDSFFFAALASFYALVFATFGFSTVTSCPLSYVMPLQQLPRNRNNNMNNMYKICHVLLISM